MVCEMPEWSSNDLWIEATPPIPPQETSLVWEKQVEEASYVKLIMTARGPSLIALKMIAPPGAVFIRPPATSAEREELKVKLISGEERQSTTFEIELLLGELHHSNLTVSISGHHTSGEGMLGPVLQQFKEEHPVWMTISAYTLENKRYSIPLL